MRILFCIFILNSLILSAPSITGTNATGTFSNGQSVTITGTVFTTKSTAAPRLWDAIDNISAYSEVSDGDAVPAGIGYPWGMNGFAQPDNIKMERALGNQRGVSTACYAGFAVDGWQAFMGNLNTGTLTPPVLFVSWWFWTSTIIPPSGHSSKYIRTADQTDQVNMTLSWTQAQDEVYQRPSDCNVGGYQYFCANHWDTYIPTVNTWHHLEIAFNNVDRTYTIYCDNTLFSSQGWSPGTLNFNQVWKIGWDGGGDADVPIDLRMDDIYVDTTYNRIIIGNASTYSACTHTELQPLTAWSQTSATFTLNRGTFAADASVYLFVIDSLNAPSAGFPITLGSGSSGTSLTLVGGTSTDASLAANYNPTQVPSSLDTIILNSGSTNFTVGSVINVAYISQVTGYTGTITINDTLKTNYLGIGTCIANFYAPCIIKDSVVYASASTPTGYTGSKIVSVAGSTLRVKLNGNIGTPRVVMTPGSKIKW